MARESQRRKHGVNRLTTGKIGGLSILAPLDPEVERALYPIIREGRRAASVLEKNKDLDRTRKRQLMRLRHEGQEAESLLLRATCGLVRARVIERGYRYGSEDLEAAGIEGLVNALKRFDPDQGNRFSTYANYWITKLVNQAIQHQAGLSDAEMRLVLKLQKLERTATTALSKKEIATKLEITPAKAQEIQQLSREFQSRRYATTELDEAKNIRLASDPGEAPSWVIDALRRLCGEDFDAFWQATFKTMSLEDIAKRSGVSRQAMTKRIEKCRRLVRESPEAKRLQHWFNQQ